MSEIDKLNAQFREMGPIRKPGADFDESFFGGDMSEEEFQRRKEIAEKYGLIHPRKDNVLIEVYQGIMKGIHKDIESVGLTLEKMGMGVSLVDWSRRVQRRNCQWNPCQDIFSANIGWNFGYFLGLTFPIWIPLLCFFLYRWIKKTIDKNKKRMEHAQLQQDDKLKASPIETSCSDSSHELNYGHASAPLSHVNSSCKEQTADCANIASSKLSIIPQHDGEAGEAFVHRIMASPDIDAETKVKIYNLLANSKKEVNKDGP